MSRLECPTHVIVSADSAARGTANAGRARRFSDGSGSFGPGRALRCTSIHLSKLPKPGTASATQGFRKPPPRPWGGGGVDVRREPENGRVEILPRDDRGRVLLMLRIDDERLDPVRVVVQHRCGAVDQDRAVKGRERHVVRGFKDRKSVV